MPLAIDPDSVLHVARLARLNLTEDERRALAEQLGRILSFFEELQQVDTSAVEPLSHPLAVTDVMRDDEPGVSFDSSVALKNAPARHEGFFKVPRVLAAESGV